MTTDSLNAGGYSIFHETMADMTYPEVVDAARNGAAVLWGLGVIEEHGPHLPLATDVYLPYALLRQTRHLLTARNIPSILMPPFYWGVNFVTTSFPATFEVRPEIVLELMVDIIKNLKKDNFQNLFCVSGHGDALHNKTMLAAIKRAAHEAPMNAYLVCTPPFLNRLKADPAFDPADPTVIPVREASFTTEFMDIHAGESETSSMWGVFPDVVRQDILKTLKPTNFTLEDLNEWRKGRDHAKRKTPQGYLGDPAASDPRRGEQLLRKQAEFIADAIEQKLPA
ncbi:MAG: creatininase family protein [Xanthobacteraceae bacterium]